MIWIPLYNRVGEVTDRALVDDDMAHLLEFRWHKNSDGYAIRRKGSNPIVTIHMHRVVLGLTDPKVFGDHRDFNRLDNRRENLRATTKRGNNLHSPKQRGVSYDKRRGHWRAYITEHGRQRELGRFKTEVEARVAAGAARLVAIASEETHAAN
jgi:hypothetical protein